MARLASAADPRIGYDEEMGMTRSFWQSVWLTVMHWALVSLAALMVATASAVPKGGPKFETDSGTMNLLRRYLISGGDISYPLEAARRKEQGSALFFMRLRPDGTVESVTVNSSTGYAGLDQHVARTLRGYRFKPKTKSPLIWLVSFAQPATVIIKVYHAKEKDASTRLPK